MRKQTLFLLLVLCVSAISLAIPASAEEVTITFDEGNVRAGDALTDQYANEGVTFSQTKVVDTNPLPTVTDLGIVPTNGFCQINFNPYVRSVSIDFEDAASGLMAGVTINGRPVADFEWSARENTLQVSSSDSNPIKVIAVTYLTNSRSIQFDNLRYDQIRNFQLSQFQ